MTYEERSIILTFLEDIKPKLTMDLYIWLVAQANADYQRTLRNQRKKRTNDTR